MHASRNRPPHQQKVIVKEASNQDSTSFFNLLTAPELLDTIETLLPLHRERQFPPTETLAMFLAQAMNPDRSCQRAVNDAATSRVITGLKPCSTFTGAYCKARQRLPLELVSALVTQTGKLIDQQTPMHGDGEAVQCVSSMEQHLLCQTLRKTKPFTHNKKDKSLDWDSLSAALSALPAYRVALC